MKGPRFEVYHDKAKKFRFRLLAANGEPVAMSEAYESKASVMSTVKRIGAMAAKAAIVDMTVAPKAAPAKKVAKKK
jgi:uncharacterized protein YegP (UPF0339 family)